MFSRLCAASIRDLGGKGLQGSLPGELAGMDQLQLLSLGGNALTGDLPATWGAAGAFPLLVSLDVNGSSLTGARLWHNEQSCT